MIPMRTRVYRLVMVFLLAVYGLAAYVALHPDVHPDYRAYYIDRSTTIPPMARKRLQPYGAGTAVDHRGASRVLFEGWSLPEATHRWSLGMKSEILFYAEDKGLFTGRILLNCFYFRTQRVTVAFNGRTIASCTGTGEDVSRIIPFDPALLKEKGLNRIRFSLPDAGMPGTEDRRKLALALREITIL